MSDVDVAAFLDSLDVKPGNLVETPDGRTFLVGTDGDFFDVGDGGAQLESLSEDGDSMEKEIWVKPGEECRIRFLLK